MSMPWAIRIPADRANAAATMRLSPGVETCDADGELWLRGQRSDEDLDRQVRMLPTAGRYTVLEDGRITPTGDRVPIGRLPKGPWTPIASRFAPIAPTAALPGELPESSPSTPHTVMLALVPSDEPRPSTVLITSWSRFVAWAQTAPEARLRQLGFAPAEDGRVFIRGTPLPPIAGRRYVESKKLVLPAGYRLEPAIDHEAALQMLRGNHAGSDELFVFSDDATFERLPIGSLIPASRRAVRLMEEQRRV